MLEWGTRWWGTLYDWTRPLCTQSKGADDGDSDEESHVSDNECSSNVDIGIVYDDDGEENFDDDNDGGSKLLPDEVGLFIFWGV